MYSDKFNINEGTYTFIIFIIVNLVFIYCQLCNLVF